MFKSPTLHVMTVNCKVCILAGNVYTNIMYMQGTVVHDKVLQLSNMINFHPLLVTTANFNLSAFHSDSDTGRVH